MIKDVNVAHLELRSVMLSQDYEFFQERQVRMVFSATSKHFDCYGSFKQDL